MKSFRTVIFLKARGKIYGIKSELPKGDSDYFFGGIKW